MTELQKKKTRDCINLIVNGKCDNIYLTRENAMEILEDYAKTLDEEFTRFVLKNFYTLATKYSNSVEKYKEVTKHNADLRAKLEAYRRKNGKNRGIS